MSTHIQHRSNAESGSLPVALTAAFFLVIAGGLLMGLTRDGRTEAALSSSIEKADASVSKEEDGLLDAYGVVQFRLNPRPVTDYFSYCETRPEMALRLFRGALESGNSSKLIALSSAFYLAQRGVLEKEDVEKIVARLDPQTEKDAEVRKAAQRALAELILIDDVAAGEKYQVIPAAYKPTGTGANRIQTREEKLRGSGKAILYIRWSNSDLAFSWWQANAASGKWDKALQRYIFGNPKPD